MRDRIDVMVDIETLGTDANAFTFQIAACAFDIITGEIVDTFNETVDITQENNLNINGDTLMWWLKTDKELLFNLLSNGKISSEKQLFDDFVNWYKELDCELKNTYLWGNGILFDNNIIRTHCQKYNVKYPVFYRNDRDVRTIINLVCEKLGVTEKEYKETVTNEHWHDAFCDVKYQIALVVKAYNLLIQ